MSEILKDGSSYKLYTQAKSTSACGLPKGFFINVLIQFTALHSETVFTMLLVLILFNNSYQSINGRPAL